MLKIKKDLEQIKSDPIKKIANHLITKAENDELIKNVLNKENKSLNGMYAYVTSEAKKLAENGSAMIEDGVVYGWAQHYYDEDSIDFEPKKRESSKPKVEEVELPEEEIDVFDF